jgi:hypothetical protein
MVQLLLKDDSNHLNPFEGLGHFVCVDGFGRSRRKKKRLDCRGTVKPTVFPGISCHRAGRTERSPFSSIAALPLVHENFRRTLRMVDAKA